MFCDIPHNWYKLQYGGTSPRDDLWKLVGGGPLCCTFREKNRALVPTRKSNVKNSFIFPNPCPGYINFSNGSNNNLSKQSTNRFQSTRYQDIKNVKECDCSEAVRNSKHQVNKCDFCCDIQDENTCLNGRCCEKLSRSSNFSSICCTVCSKSSRLSRRNGCFSCNNISNNSEWSQCECNNKNCQTTKGFEANRCMNNAIIFCQVCNRSRHLRNNNYTTCRINKADTVKRSSLNPLGGSCNNMFDKHCRTACHGSLNSINKDKDKKWYKVLLKKKVIINPSKKDPTEHNTFAKNMLYNDERKSCLCEVAEKTPTRGNCCLHKLSLCKHEENSNNFSCNEQFTVTKIREECERRPPQNTTCECKDYVRKHFSDLINMFESQMKTSTEKPVQITALSLVTKEQSLEGEDSETTVDKIKRIGYCSFLIFEKVLEHFKEKLEKLQESDGIFIRQIHDTLQTDMNILDIQFSSTESEVEKDYTKLKTMEASLKGQKDNETREIIDISKSLLSELAEAPNKEIKMKHSFTQTYSVENMAEMHDIHAKLLEAWGNVCSKIVSETLQLSAKSETIIGNDEEKPKFALHSKPKKYSFFSRKSKN